MRVLLRLLGAVWALPITLLGLLVAAVFYGARDWRWEGGGWITCVARRSMWGRPAGQTWGTLSAFSGEAHRNDPALRVHESCHADQARVLGLVFPLAYFGHWALLMIRCPAEPAGWPRWRRAYWAIWAERMARGAAGV